MVRIKKRIAQSILEYVIVATAIVAVILWAAVTYIKPAVNTSLEKADSAIKNVAGRLPN